MFYVCQLTLLILPFFLNSFNIIKLDRGRMHGQAFVTFPTEEIAQEALNRTNGYVVHRDEEGNQRPIVVVS